MYLFLIKRNLNVFLENFYLSNDLPLIEIKFRFTGILFFYYFNKLLVFIFELIYVLGIYKKVYQNLFESFEVNLKVQRVYSYFE